MKIECQDNIIKELVFNRSTDGDTLELITHSTITTESLYDNAQKYLKANERLLPECIVTKTNDTLTFSGSLATALHLLAQTKAIPPTIIAKLMSSEVNTILTNNGRKYSRHLFFTVAENEFHALADYTATNYQNTQ